MNIHLIDSDILAYRFGHSGVVDLDFGDGDGAELVDPKVAIAEAQAHLDALQEELGEGEMVLCWSDPGEWENFRLEIDPTYKWRRPGHAGRPSNYDAVREWATGTYRSYTFPRLEADDVLGIIATAPATMPGTRTIVSVDKDLKQIPGRHYNPVTKDISWSDAFSGSHFHMVQTLAGDQVDDYDGIWRVGTKTAEKILAPAELDPVLEWELVLDAYWASNQFDDPEAAALRTARLAYILQWDDWTPNLGPRMWEPPR